MVLENMGDELDQYNRIEKFRELMARDQHMESAGFYRREFYSEVVVSAREVRQSFMFLN